MRPFMLPAPLALASEQLRQAKLDKLNHEAHAESYQAQANAEQAHAAILRLRIARLEQAILQLKKESNGSDS